MVMCVGPAGQHMPGVMIHDDKYHDHFPWFLINFDRRGIKQRRMIFAFIVHITHDCVDTRVDDQLDEE